MQFKTRNREKENKKETQTREGEIDKGKRNKPNAKNGKSRIAKRMVSSNWKRADPMLKFPNTKKTQNMKNKTNHNKKKKIQKIDEMMKE